MANTPRHVPRAEVGGARFSAIRGEALSPIEPVPRRIEAEAPLWTLLLLP